jgi:hypothetical protein
MIVLSINEYLSCTEVQASMDQPDCWRIVESASLIVHLFTQIMVNTIEEMNEQYTALSFF